MTEPQYVTNDRYVGAAKRISEQFRQVDLNFQAMQAQIGEINNRRRTAMQELAKNVRAEYVAGRAAVEALIVATDQLTREREHGIELQMGRLRDDITVLQKTVASQIGPGRLTELEHEVERLNKYNSEHSAEARNRRFTIYIAILTGAISLLVALAVSFIGHLFVQSPARPANRPSPTPLPTVTEICQATGHGQDCYQSPIATPSRPSGTTSK